MSHGRSTASLQKLADEIGCKRETVKKGIEYWIQNGKQFGINILVTERNRQSYIIEIEIDRCEEPTTGKVLTKNNRKRVLRELYDDQDGKCFYCKKQCSLALDASSKEEKNAWFEIEHKIPLSKGGLDITTNIVGACHECNQKKGVKTDEEFMQTLTPKRGVDEEVSTPQKGGTLTPKRGVGLPPKRGTKEDNNKKNPEEDITGQDPKDIARVIEVFAKTVNPTIRYDHPLQRKAAARMIKRFGIEKVLSMAHYAVKVQADQYAPVITTPYKLEEKMAQLGIHFKRAEAKAPLIAEV